jgi:hypothetical protein
MSRALVVPVLLSLCAGWGAVAACTTVAPTVRRGQRSVAADEGVAIGRLAFGTRRAIVARDFELTAVKVPEGDTFRIQFSAAGGSPADGGSFFVQLPGGQYRLTRWTAVNGDEEWGDEDTGLAVDIVAGEIACVGALYVPVKQRQKFTLEPGNDSGQASVRDECEALAASLQQRSPRLKQAPVVRLARVVSRKD